ncbi:MAG: TIR domain-containing protein [Anaerolineae bacterium]
MASRYAVHEMIRRGSVSELWMVSDQVLNRRVALRIVKNELLSNQHYLARFEQESQIVASLEHPHIVPIYDYGIHGNRPFQIQRQVGNDSLLTWYFQQKKPILSSILLRISQQVASALDFIHQHGIVHRALSANTIIMDEDAQPYLINFTVAQKLEDNHSSKDAAKYAVLSPEEKQGSAVDIPSDIYAFGLLLYSLFTGEREPAYQSNQVVSKVRDFRPDLPIGVDVVVSRLLHSDPAQRYQSASDAIDDLMKAFYSGQSSVDGRVFISYARKDNDYVYTLARELRRIGLDIWIDQDIEPGANWDKTIESALAHCDKMLLIVSPDAMRSENVQDEWSYFLEEGKFVFPFIYRECEMSFRLRRRQYITRTGDLLNDVARIVDVLAGGNPTRLTTI